jgi:hypothetical protein
MNLANQPTMIARCEVECQIPIGTTGRYTPRMRCGAFPARLAPDGGYFCAKCFTRFWECATCQAIGATTDDITWDTEEDVGYCTACWCDKAAR